MMVLREIYQTWVNDNSWHQDDSQLELINIMENYRYSLENNEKSIFSFFKLKKESDASIQLTKKGIYIWGEVGRGKTMLMDIFYNNLYNTPKIRLHFHQFMANFHQQLHLMRIGKKGKQDNRELLPKVMQQIASGLKVLCLDELQINNIADAMLVERIFSLLIKMGVFVIFTSNRPPADLFKDDLQYEKLLPFIKLVEQHLLIYNLNNYKDYRLEKITDLTKVYYHPLSQTAEIFIVDAKQLLSGHSQWHEKNIEISPNRYLRALDTYGHIAHFTFNELCNTPLGAADYMALCHNFNTIIISNIPQLGPEDHNQALRFITLIDCLYENKTRLICTAEVAPEDLYTGSRNKFEFARTISRLREMQTTDYLQFN
jgi:cell division protein ZapE